MRTPTRRRRRAGAVDLDRARRARRGRSLRRGPKAFVVRTLALLGLGSLAYAGWMLQVREVRVVGLHELQPALVARVAALRGGERILFTRMREVERRVESLPGVRDASVRRALPATVIVRVTERTPLVRLDSRPQLAADSEGVLFPAPAGLGAPALQGWSGRAAEGRRLDRVSRGVLAAFAAFPADLRKASHLRAGEDVLLTLSDGVQVRFGRPVSLGTKAAAARAVLVDARAKGMTLEYVDVRAPRTPVVGGRDAPSPAATAKPKPRPTAKPSPRASPRAAARTPSPRPATPRASTPKP